MRTSRTHPLQIAAVQGRPEHGRIGVTFCPGKQQTDAQTGSWARDLATDLDAIADWNASAVVSLIERHEFDELKVSALGDEVRRRHMDWYHLPIPDFSPPGDAFEEAWRTAGEELRSRLRNGFDIVVHCKGGLGRAGTVAARLLIEIGHPAEAAIQSVRSQRPGAIETRAQEDHVRATRPVNKSAPEDSLAAVEDRAIGALLGLAAGDAVGTTLEFRPRDSEPLLTDMVGGGPFGLRAGQWTDDTAMALALADSLLAHPGLDEQDLMVRFWDWWSDGRYACTGTCFDIGTTVSAALQRWRRTGKPVAGSQDPMTAGNGGLMRLAPVAIRFWNDRDRLTDVAARQSRTTHAAPEAVEACVAYAGMLADLIAGRPLEEVLASPNFQSESGIGQILAGSWRGKRRREVRASGYVAHSLEAALWSVGRSGDFRQSVLAAANLGEDADTTAAIAGQLAGAAFGAVAIPEPWRKRLAWSDQIQRVARELFAESFSRYA